MNRFPERSSFREHDRPLRFSPEQPARPWSPKITDVPPKRFPVELIVGLLAVLAIGAVVWMRG